VGLHALRIEELVRARRLMLLLDLDGTLIPYARTAEEAILDQDGAELLNTLEANDVRLAVISGRGHALVEPIHAAVPGILCAAEHGAWRRTQEGWSHLHAGDTAVVDLSDQLALIADATPGARIERKSNSVALHWREVSAIDRRTLHPVVDALLEEWLAIHPRFRRLAGVEMIEILPRDTHKGHAVAWIREMVAPCRFIAIGDDVTDEDMFAALDERDLSIAVGNRARPTRALARLDGVDDVRRFLRWLLDARTASGPRVVPPPFLRPNVDPPRTSFLTVSCRVPRPTDAGIRDGRGPAAALQPVLDGFDGLWLGWSGQECDADLELCFEPDETPPRVTFDLSPEKGQLFEAGFCNRVLWPLLHGFPDAVGYDDDEWNAYVACNDAFAEAARQVTRPDAVVLIHDFHLLLAGVALRRRGHRGPLALFLHAPFPPASVFDTLPWAKQLLGAMSAFDLVGFQSLRWERNYLETRAALGSAVTGSVGVFPFGIDLESFCTPSLTPKQPEVERLLASLGDCKLLLGVDRLDPTKGILQRLAAYERLLERSPHWRRKVSFLQITVPSHSDVNDNHDLRRLVEHQVGRINGHFGETDWVPVRYLSRVYDRDTLAQLYREADVAVVTPLCDGLNLVAKEFVAAQEPRDPGVLVLSRFAGAADDLRQAVLTNPFHRDGLAADLERALSMDLVERRARHVELLAGVARTSASSWADHFLAALAAQVSSSRAATSDAIICSY
jgi:alpha,alpha-trehalose-phosphate synthase [UDP-forming]/trehalose-phosphatase